MQGPPDRQFPPSRRASATVAVDAYSGLLPGPFTTETVNEIFRQRAPRRRRSTTRRPGSRSTPRPACSGRTAASGRRSPRGSSTSRTSTPASRSGRSTIAAGPSAAARGVGVRGGPEGDADRRTSTGSVASSRSGRRWGAPFAPTKLCPTRRRPHADPPDRARAARCPSHAHPARRDPRPSRTHREAARRRPSLTGPPSGRRAPSTRADDRRPVAALAALAGSDLPDERVRRRRCPHGVPQGARPEPVDDRDLVEPGQRRVVEVAAEEPRAPRRRARRAGRATTPRRRSPIQPDRRRRCDGPRPVAPARRAGRRRPSVRSLGRSRHVASRGTAGRSRARARGRRASTVTRRPPASSVARFPPRSSAAIRPSQPPAAAPRPVAEPPGVVRAGSAAARGRLALGRRASQALRRGHGRVERRRGDRLALQRPPGRADLVAQLGDERAPPRARAGPDRLVALAPRAAAAPPRPRAAPRRPRTSAARARSSASAVAPSVALIEASVASNARCVSVSRDRASATMAAGRPSRSAIAKAWLPPGRPIVSRYVGLTASRGRTRPRRCAPPASCGRRP